MYGVVPGVLFHDSKIISNFYRYLLLLLLDEKHSSWDISQQILPSPPLYHEMYWYRMRAFWGFCCDRDGNSNFAYINKVSVSLSADVRKINMPDWRNFYRSIILRTKCAGTAGVVSCPKFFVCTQNGYCLQFYHFEFFFVLTAKSLMGTPEKKWGKFQHEHKGVPWLNKTRFINVIEWYKTRCIYFDVLQWLKEAIFLHVKP